MNNIEISMPEIPPERGDDIHNFEDMHSAELVLFMAGNQFMVMDELLRGFRKMNPEIKSIFYETLPPGLELKQILAGGATFKNILIDVVPDIYTSVTEDSMKELSSKGFVRDYFVYLHNRIVFMVPPGNPAGIRSVSDLGQDNLRISQPGEMEDISFYIADMHRKAGGDALAKQILETKRIEGTTLFTTVHHRETLLRIQEGAVDVGPVWATEVYNAINSGMKVEKVEPGEGLDQREKVNYHIARIVRGAHPENAEKFLNFIQSSPAQDTYSRLGFVPHFE